MNINDLDSIIKKESEKVKEKKEVQPVQNKVLANKDSSWICTLKTCNNKNYLNFEDTSSATCKGCFSRNDNIYE